MSIQQTLQNEIEDSKRWFELEKNESTYKKVNKLDSAVEADQLHSELRILDWIFFQVCSNEIKKFERL
jgi:hypothetical protein